jgi:hypothetical protein
MATNTRNSTSQRRSRKSLRYFYINSDLHKVLRIVRPEDFVEAWNYRLGKRVGYVWSDVRKRMENAYTMQEVGQMVGRHRVQIENYILNGHIKTPQRIYTLDGEAKPGKYLFSETDVLGLHDYLLTVHIGRPRKDGKITPGKLPTRAELRAMLKHNLVTYVKTDDNEFRPIWKEKDW